MQAAKLFVAQCLEKDPEKRPTADELLQQPFVRQAKDCDYLCRRLLGHKPSLRKSTSVPARATMLSRYWPDRLAGQHRLVTTVVILAA